MLCATMPAPTIPRGLHRVGTIYGNCHVLEEAGRAVVLDTALGGGARRRFQKLFARLDLEPSCVEAIILTHGHLDHTGNAAWLKSWTGARVLAHPAEQVHVDGRFRYRGIARVCGVLEAAGRAVFRYRTVAIDRTLADGEVLPWWGGLRVVHLPGHSAGHCGLWSEKHRLLFAGDLVAIWPWRTTFPPPIFNSAPQFLRDSLRRAAALQPVRVIPCHYSRFDPEWMGARFREFARRKGCA